MMRNMEVERGRPSPNEDTKPYWDGLKQGRLLLQKCGDCGAIRHYPRQVCDKCFSMDVEWIESSGKGTVHSWTVSQHAFHPSFKGDLPMTFVTVDVDEGVRIAARLRGNDRSEEHTSELQSLMRISYAVFCLKKKKK